MRIAIMGAGSMGGYLGGRLAQAGRDVTFIARGRHLLEIQRNGLHVQSPSGDFVVNPAVATDDPVEAGPVDLILFCVKSYDVVEAAKMSRPLLGPQTTILPIQNGIGHIEKIGHALGAEHVLGGVSLLSARISAPGTIHRNPGSDRLEFGEIEGGHSSRCERIETVLAVDGIKATARADIVERMWWKLAAYSGVGVFCMVRGDRSVLWATPETKELYRQAIAEVVTVARAKGVPLADTVPDEHIAILDTFPPDWKPSMLVALEQGYRLELESLQGALCAIGRDMGVPTPLNDVVYACLKPHIDGSPQAAVDH